MVMVTNVYLNKLLNDLTEMIVDPMISGNIILMHPLVISHSELDNGPFTDDVPS